MKTINVLSTLRFSEEQLARLRVLSPQLRVVQHSAREADEVPPDVWSATEVLYTFMALPAAGQAPHLRWIQLHSAGAEHATDPATSGDVTLTTSSGIHAVTIGEYTLALMLAWSHRLPALVDHQRRAEWPDQRWERFAPHELRESTLGIVGYGSIGREVGRLAHAFGMHVLALHRSDEHADQGYVIPGTGDPQGTIPERFYHPDGLRAMLARCDYVVLAVPLTDATRHLIGTKELQAMKPTAFLINVARGGVVDEEALIRALEEGWIAGAGLDVFAQEPLPPDSPLWHMDNAILTPHIAGFTLRYDERAIDLFAENLRRYLAGEPLLNRVDPEKGY